MPSPEFLIERFGYVALLIGALLEGETILIAAGFAASRGYLELPMVWAIAFAGSFAGDQFYFFLGRCKGQAFLAKRPELRSRIERVNRYLEKYQTWLILSFRFFYGFRTVTPFAIGLSRVKSSRFIWLNGLSAFVWALAIGSFGYFFGEAIATLFGDIRRYEKILLLGILAAGGVIWVWHRLRRKKRALLRAAVRE